MSCYQEDLYRIEDEFVEVVCALQKSSIGIVGEKEHWWRSNMDTSKVLATLRAERDQLSRAIAALESLNGIANAVRSPKTIEVAEAKRASKKRAPSAAVRKKMSEAAKTRWVLKKQTDPQKVSSNNVVPKKAAPNAAKKRVVRAETRKKMAEAQQKRWAKKKRAVREAAKKMAAAPVGKVAVKEASKGWDTLG